MTFRLLSTVALMLTLLGTRGRLPPAPLQPPALSNAGSAAVYVSDSLNNAVDVFDRNGAVIGQITEGLNAPAGLWVDSKHDLWVANPGAGNVLMFPRGASVAAKTLIDSNDPNDVTTCPDGTVYVADSGGAFGIGVYPAGSRRAKRRLQTEVSGNSGPEYYVTCDANGNVFATGLLGASPATGVTGWTGGTQSGYHFLTWGPGGGIKATPSQTLLAATGYSVTEYTENGQPTGAAISTGQDFWTDIALDRSGNVVFGANPNAGACDSRTFPGGKRRRTYNVRGLQPAGVAFDP